MPPQTKDKICWINLNVFVYCTIKLSIISAKIHTGLFKFWHTSSSPGPFVLKWNHGTFPNHESVPWLRKGGGRGWLNFSCWVFPHLVWPRPPTIMRPEPLWPGQGNFIETRPPSLFAIQTQFCDNLVTIILQLSSVRDDLTDPLASKPTNKKISLIPRRSFWYPHH